MLLFLTGISASLCELQRHEGLLCRARGRNSLPGMYAKVPYVFVLT